MDTPHTYPKGCVFSSLSDIKGKKVTVMGLGLNGGGEATVSFFLKHGAFVTVTDTKSKELLAKTISKLESDESLDKSRLKYVLGEHRKEDFSTADCVIKNPGVRFEGNPYLQVAKAVETDLSLFLHFTKAPIIAVTGSKGKSSTVSAIAFGLSEAGFKTFLGGNITVSPLTFLEETDETTPVVLELSSWQLRDLRGRGVLKPKIALITKIVPDHQNFYGNMDSYVDDKRLIYAEQDAEDFAIFDFDEDGYTNECASPKENCFSWGESFAREARACVLRYSKKSLPKNIAGVFQQTTFGNAEGFVQNIKQFKNDGEETKKIIGKLLVPGEHNRSNVLNAALVMYLMNVAPSKIETILSRWTGIPHRLERFFEWKNSKNNLKVEFFNDSCATVPEATVAAVKAFETSVILIAGGTDKGLDFTNLAETLKQPEFAPKRIYLLAGTGTDLLLPLLENARIPYFAPFDSLDNLLEVLKSDLNAENAQEAFVPLEKNASVPVVFSPGATSFGMFANEFERGNLFKEKVVRLFS